MENLSFPDPILRAAISEVNQEAQFLDGFDEAIVGTVEAFGKPQVVCYDRDIILDIIMDSTGGNRQDAEEYFEVNILGAYAGENTPVFLSRSGVND